MFIKRDNAETIAEVVTRNTGVEASEFIKEEKMLYIYNLEEAAEFIKNYIESNPDCPVSIVGDYDSDGINGTCVLYWAFRALGIKPYLRLPHRFTEGFGLNVNIIDEIESGLLVTVDNGVAAYDAIKKAKDKGLAVVVIDHHLAPVDENGNQKLPPADIIVDPSIEDISEFHSYCGGALAYRLAKELHPDKMLRELEVLASIATVTDVMPLVRENRAIVREGLEHINNGFMLPGLKALYQELSLNKPINEDTYGFNIGPCFNASGRLYDDGAERVLSLLVAGKTSPETMHKAQEIIRTNERRKDIVREDMKVALSKVTDTRPIVVVDENFGEGIVGIIAGRLTEEFNCPSIVFTKGHTEGILKGSGRSIEGYNLKEILDRVAARGLVYKFGGHAGAVGVSIEAKNLEAFTKAFVEETGELPVKTDDVYYDLELDFDTLDETMEDLDKYAPYGEGNARPVFHLTYECDGIGKKIADGSHFYVKDSYMSVMGFGLAEKWESLGCPTKMEMVGYISESEWNGKISRKFELVDFKPVY